MTSNDLERLFHDKMRFRPPLLESERLNVRNSTTSAILWCSVHALHDQLASLGRHAQLTRCFSAVAELLVNNICVKFAANPFNNSRVIAV